MKPLSAKTEFRFTIKRKYINCISDSFKGGLMEKLDINYGSKNNAYLDNCHVVYTLANSIQTTSLNNLNEKLINRYESLHRGILLKRIAEVKNEIKEIKMKTMLTFTKVIIPRD